MRATAYLFRRKAGIPIPGSGPSGHIGWAYQIAEDGSICVGSTENPRLLPWLKVGQNNGWWSTIVPNVGSMEHEMRERLYDDYKVVHGDVAFLDRAQEAALNARDCGYSFTGNNCLDHAYHVIFAYGAPDLPLPFIHPIPNAWFSALAGEWRSLHASG